MLLIPKTDAYLKFNPGVQRGELYSRKLDREVFSSFKLLGVTLDDKLTFESIFAILPLLLPKNWSYSQILQDF